MLKKPKNFRERKKEFILELFNYLAPSYDLLNNLLSFGLHFLWKKRAVKILRVNDPEKILDVCAGTGDLAIIAAKDTQGKGRIFLYDFSRAMILKGREKIKKKLNHNQIYFIQGQAEEISAAPEKFDAAMIGFGLRNLTDMKQGMKEVYRVLQPGGKFVVLEFSQPKNKWFKLIYDFYSFYIIPWVGKIISGSKEAYIYLPHSIKAFPKPEEIKDLLEEVGFAEVNYYPLTNGVAVVYRAIKPSCT